MTVKSQPNLRFWSQSNNINYLLMFVQYFIELFLGSGGAGEQGSRGAEENNSSPMPNTQKNAFNLSVQGK